MVTIKIKTVNGAFEDGKGREVARILRKLADDVEDCEAYQWSLFDLNGNKVGEVRGN